jgi:hypothetical protein
VLPAATSSGHLAVPQDSSRAALDHAPNIRHAPALQDPADPVLQADAQDSALVQGSARHDLALREHAQVAVLLRLEKLHDRSAPRIIGVVAVASSIRRRRKAQ